MNPLLVILLLFAFCLGAGSGNGSAYAQTGTRLTGLKVMSGRAGSVVFLNDIRHGVTNAAGVLELARMKPGVYRVRVRTVGYVDWVASVVLAAAQTRLVQANQKEEADEATLHCQRGDELRENGKHQAAVEEYAAAVALRPGFSDARIGAARSLVALQKFDRAETEIDSALRAPRANLVEARTVLGNMRRQQGLTDEAIVEYRKALRLGRGVSPEAHIGLALALEESGKREEAIGEFRLGIAQDMDTEPILYYLLGSALEKLNRNKEAIEAYGNYLRLDPEGQYASAVQSMIDRLKDGSTDR